MANVEEKDTVIIGAGPGGYVAAIRAAELGQKVTIIEKEYFGGVCLNVGCVPSKALIQAGHRYREAKDATVYGISTKDVELDFTKTQAWKNKNVVERMTSGVQMLLKKHKVEIIKGEAFLDNNEQLRVMPAGPRQFMDNGGGQTIKFKNLILATGSRPLEIKGFKFGGRVLSSTGLLNIEELPKKLVIVGGGYIGSELAGSFSDLGSEVTILEGTDQIIPNFERDMVSIIEKHLQKKGIKIVTSAMAKSVQDNGDSVDVTYAVDGQETTINADYVMVSVGRRPNTDNFGLEMTDVELTDRGLVKVDEQGRTSVKNIYAVGDITAGPALAHKAFFQGKTAAGAISGKNTANDYIGIPSVCFNDPEMASVGLTADEAKAQKREVKISKFPFAGNARAVSLDNMDGFVKLISDKNTGTVLGGQIVGPNASDLISEVSILVNCQLNVEDVALTIHPHPTLGEPIQEAADMAMGFPTHI